MHFSKRAANAGLVWALSANTRVYADNIARSDLDLLRYEQVFSICPQSLLLQTRSKFATVTGGCWTSSLLSLPAQHYQLSDRDWSL